MSKPHLETVFRKHTWFNLLTQLVPVFSDSIPVEVALGTSVNTTVVPVKALNLNCPSELLLTDLFLWVSETLNKNWGIEEVMGVVVECIDPGPLTFWLYISLLPSLHLGFLLLLKCSLEESKWIYWKDQPYLEDLYQNWLTHTYHFSKLGAQICLILKNVPSTNHIFHMDYKNIFFSSL